MAEIFRATVDELDGDGLASDFEAKLMDGVRDAAENIVRVHEESIRSASSPLGGPQQRNGAGASARKGGRPPLYDTGRLMRGLRIVERPDGVDIVPPPDRADVVESLHRRGYVTVFAGDADDFKDDTQREISEEVAKLDVKGRIKRRRLR